jgi:hypothetical protein
MEHYIRTTHPQGANHTPMAGHPLFIEGKPKESLGVFPMLSAPRQSNCLT